MLCTVTLKTSLSHITLMNIARMALECKIRYTHQLFERH